MPSNEYFLGAYWPSRKESIGECADRLQKFFNELALCDPALATWFELGGSRQLALERTADVSDRDYLLHLLNLGRNRRDSGRTVIEELGFHIGLWNGGGDENEIGLSIRCGLHWQSPIANASVSNYVTLELPQQLGGLKRVERMARLLEVVAEAWEPEWAGVMSRSAMDARGFNAKKPFVDWMIYLNRTDLAEFKLPPHMSIRLVDGLGTIVITQRDPTDSTHPLELEHVLAIERALRI